MNVDENSFFDGSKVCRPEWRYKTSKKLCNQCVASGLGVSLFSLRGTSWTVDWSTRTEAMASAKKVVEILMEGLEAGRSAKQLPRARGLDLFAEQLRLGMAQA